MYNPLCITKNHDGSNFSRAPEMEKKNMVRFLASLSKLQLESHQTSQVFLRQICFINKHEQAGNKKNVS